MLPLLERVANMRAARLFHPPGVVGGPQGSDSRRYNK